MERNQEFNYVNSTYFRMFGPSQMNVFFEERPHNHEGLTSWKLRRAFSYFIAFVYFPTFCLIETTGILFGRNSELEEVIFAIAYISFMVQMVIKLSYFHWKIEDFRELCLQFEYFHTSRHRPDFAKGYLEEASDSLRRTAKVYNFVIYVNLILWNLNPLVVQPVRFVLNLTGFTDDKDATLIPDIFPVVYMFDETKTWYLRTLTGCLEWIVLNAGLCHAVALELFFMSLFLMLAAEVEVINKSAQSTEELGREIERDYSTLLGPRDDLDRIDITLLIEDHRIVLKKINKVSDIMNPLLGLAIGYCMVVLPTLGVVITKAIRDAKSTTEAFLNIITWIGATITELLVLFMYSWICAKLKDSEEGISEAVYSTNWYERDIKYKKTVLFIMMKSLRPKKMRMLYCGDMDRETFVVGLKGIYSFYNFMIGLA
ncbi:odorant receptor 85c [Halyomorpha halys]|uniref:odorant receptor 85c n=1 Tax=Halyomorpha halys TaxID=286706 RepID=UPI0034D33CDA|nr:Odorant receptor 123 [Halyomorpha halys]